MADLESFSEVERLRAQLEITCEMLVELREATVLVSPSLWHGKSTLRVRTLMSNQVAMDREIDVRVVAHRKVAELRARAQEEEDRANGSNGVETTP
jgi:hypothetical protein